MDSNNNSITIVIIIAVIIILGVRFFLSNRESAVNEDEVRDKINTAIELTQTAVASNPQPIEATSASGVLRSTLTSQANPLNGTVSAQETRIAALVATSDAQSAITPIIAPTLTPTPVSAVGAMRAENTAQALRATVDAQDEALANLQATNEALLSERTPTRTPIPTMVDTPDPIVLSIDNDSNLIDPDITDAGSLLSVAPNGEQIILGVMSPNTLPEDDRIETGDDGSVSITVESGDEPLVISSEDGPVIISTELALHIFDLNTAEMQIYFANGLGSADATAWSPQSDYVAVGDVNGRVVIWDVETQAIVQDLNVAGEVLEIAWSPNGALFAVMTNDVLTLFYTNTWTQMIDYPLRDGRDFAWSPTSDTIVYANGNVVHAVQMDDLYTRLVLGGYNHPIEIVTWSPDGQFIALVDDAEEPTIYLQVWPEKNILYAMPADAEVQSLAWSPDSQYIMTDGTQAHIHEVATGTLVYMLDSNTLIRDAQWMPDNTFVILRADNMVLWPNPVLGRDRG